MKIEIKTVNESGIRFSLVQQNREIGRAYLYFLKNDLHQQPFAFMEDVFIEESLRGQGLGTELVKKIIEESRLKGCYKLICTSRYEKVSVKNWYKRLGFKNYGAELRIDL